MRSASLVIAVLSLIASSALADETLKYRTVQHFASVQIQRVGDVNGHTLGLVRIPGIASFPDGSTAMSVVIGTYDAVSGSGGSGGGYSTLHFDDGSELVFKYTGTFSYSNPKVSQTGTLTVIGGKGRYAGAQGDGTYAGEGTGPAANGEAMQYIDSVITIKK
jgi:hypothetical protein